MLAAAEMDLNKETRRESDCRIILESILKNSSAALGQQDGQRARLNGGGRSNKDFGTGGTCGNNFYEQEQISLFT
jgi:hypothetical protein